MVLLSLRVSDTFCEVKTLPLEQQNIYIYIIYIYIAFFHPLQEVQIQPLNKHFLTWQ
jgi:hypothetical protein